MKFNKIKNLSLCLTFTSRKQMSLQQVWTWKRKAILLQNSYKSKVPHPTLLHNERENTVSVVFGMFSWKKNAKKTKHNPEKQTSKYHRICSTSFDIKMVSKNVWKQFKVILHRTLFNWQSQVMHLLPAKFCKEVPWEIIKTYISKVSLGISSPR